jgi:hypothetical protein
LLAFFRVCNGIQKLKEECSEKKQAYPPLNVLQPNMLLMKTNLVVLHRLEHRLDMHPFFVQRNNNFFPRLRYSYPLRYEFVFAFIDVGLETHPNDDNKKTNMK